WLRDNLRVIQAIHQAQHALEARLDAYPAQRRQTAQATNTPQPTNANQAASNTTAGTPDEELGADNLIYRPPTDQTWQDAWRVTEALILRMRDEVKTHNAQFVVVTLSNGIQVYPDAQARQAFLQRVGAQDIFYPDMRFKSLCEREHIPVLTLAPQLQTYADEHKAFLHGFGRELGNGHWNQLGHHVAGELIAQQLCTGMIH